MNLRKNQSGALNPVLIIVIVVVIAAVGFAGYMVWNNNKDKNDSASQATSQISK